MVKTTITYEGSSYRSVFCTIGNSAAKWVQFQKPVLFPPWESAASNFYTNLYGARKSNGHYRLKSAQILSRAFPSTAHVIRYQSNILR